MYRVINFYLDGFRNISSLGLKLWLIIFIKLFIMFAILKIFFFNDFLDNKFDTDNEKGVYIIQQLT